MKDRLVVTGRWPMVTLERDRFVNLREAAGIKHRKGTSSQGGEGAVECPSEASQNTVNKNELVGEINCTQALR